MTRKLHAAYLIHPPLDPFLPRNQPAIARLWIAFYRRLRSDAQAERQLVADYACAAGSRPEEIEPIDRYFHDADAYLDDLLRLIPPARARYLSPLPATRNTTGIGDLFRAMFEAERRRERFEAQRKLYLAKLFFDVDHSRGVRDGLAHKEKFERLLEERIWRMGEDGPLVRLCSRPSAGPEGDVQLEIGAPPSDETRCWEFRLRRLPSQGGDSSIDVYLYRCRFKREADPPAHALTTGGPLSLAERPRWPSLGGRSGSIVSKMVRRGIGDPRMVRDLLGAMFIVHDRRQAYALERRLVRVLGGPLRWRDRVDTLAGERERSRLDRQSSSDFRVLKVIVDVLVADPAGHAAYLVPVEVQIFPVEDYLKTLHDAHYASHAAYKRRQFLHDLMPLLFPPSIYGRVAAPAGDSRRTARQSRPIPSVA